MPHALMTMREVLALKEMQAARTTRCPFDEPIRESVLVGQAAELIRPDGTVAARVTADASAERRTALIRFGSFTEVLCAHAAITHALMVRSRELAERSRSILQALNDAELQGRSLREIVALLERLVGNPVVLKDATHRVLAWSGEPSSRDTARRETIARGAVSDAVLVQLTERGIVDRIRDTRAAFRVERDDDVGLTARVICPVRAGDTLFGYLSISEGSRQLDQVDLLAVESGATVVAFHIARERAVVESIRSQRALLLSQLLGDNSGDLQLRRERARLLEFDIDSSVVVAVIAFDPKSPQLEDGVKWAHFLEAVLRTADVTLARLNGKCLTVAERFGLLLVIPGTVHDAHTTVSSLMRDIRAYHKLPTASVGISQETRLDRGLARAYEEATTAARLGTSLHGPNAITRYSELGVLRILADLQDEEAARYLSSVLGDDEEFREIFFDTFGALANAGYNRAAAARSLFIHVNTLKYRLNRIRRVTGHDPLDHRGRFALELALRLLELQRSRQGLL